MDLNTIQTVVTRPTRADLGGWRPGDAWLAGGSWLFSEPQPHLQRLLDLGGFGWPSIEADAEGLTLAATCRIAELRGWAPPPDWMATALIDGCCRALLGSFKVWNVATVGGNICLALPAGPMTALATALDGVCTLWSADGQRSVPVLDFVRGERLTALRPGEILRSIHLPVSALRRRAALRQISLSPLGRSGALLIGTMGRAGDLALTVTASTVRPFRFDFPAPPSADRLDAALDAIPPAAYHDDVHGRPDWRRHVTRLLGREIVAELAARGRA